MVFIQSGCYNFVKSVSNLELDFKNSSIVATKDKGSSYLTNIKLMSTSICKLNPLGN